MFHVEQWGKKKRVAPEVAQRVDINPLARIFDIRVRRTMRAAAFDMLTS
jgi:hypothetical protein